MNREIGWSQEEILYYEMSKKLDRIINILCPCPTTTTTSTTTEEITTTTTTTEAPFFRMLFDSKGNADLMVGDATDVADWNTFFDLPTNGTPFTSLSTYSNGGYEITLNGGGNMTLSAYLFGDNEPTGTSLLEVEDNGVTVACGDGVFSDFNVGLGCYGLISIVLPSLNINGKNEVFADCEVLEELDIDFDSVITLGDYIFNDCSSIISFNIPNLTVMGDSCFSSCVSITEISFPLLQQCGNQCFTYCVNLNTVYLPMCEIVGFGLFAGGDIFNVPLTNVNLQSCINLGGNVTNDDVFLNITGNTITLTVPSALMTCNGGNPDGDIQYLQANNTVTIIQV